MDSDAARLAGILYGPAGGDAAVEIVDDDEDADDA